MKDPGEQNKTTKARVHIPDHSKEKTAQAVKASTEKFIQKMMLSNIKAAS